MEYQVKCSKCGFKNCGLLLEDTHGLFECEHCGTLNYLVFFRDRTGTNKDPELNRRVRIVNRISDLLKEGELDGKHGNNRQASSV